MELVTNLRSNPATLQLIEPDDLRSFRVVIVEEAPISESLFEAAGLTGHEEHVWVPIQLIQDLAGAAATTEWRDGLKSMIRYAAARGWYEEGTASIRGHCHRQASTPDDGEA